MRRRRPLAFHDGGRSGRRRRRRWASSHLDLAARVVGDVVCGGGPPPAQIRWRWASGHPDLEAGAGGGGTGVGGGGSGRRRRGRRRNWGGRQHGRQRRASGRPDLEAGVGGGGTGAGGRPARVSLFFEFYFFSQFFLFACGRFKRPHVRMRLPWPHAKIVILADDFTHIVGPTACENRFRPHAKTTSVVVRRTRALPSLLEPVRRDQLTTTS